MIAIPTKIALYVVLAIPHQACIDADLKNNVTKLVDPQANIAKDFRIRGAELKPRRELVLVPEGDEMDFAKTADPECFDIYYWKLENSATKYVAPAKK